MNTPGDRARPLVFDWKRPAKRGWGIFIWGFITLLGMAVFFYLFKVTYPQAQRFTPVPQQVFVLNPEDPAHQPIINRVRDQDYLVITGYEDSPRDTHLEDHVPVFHPSYEKHQFQLQDLPRTKINVFPARVLDPTAPILPPPDLSGLRPVEAPKTQEPRPTPITLGFSGELSKRRLRVMPDFSSLQLSDPGAWRFHIGVQTDGRVAYALPLATGDEHKTTKALLSLLSGLRFDPTGPDDQSGPVTWSTVTLHWKMKP